ARHISSVLDFPNNKEVILKYLPPETSTRALPLKFNHWAVMSTTTDPKTIPSSGSEQTCYVGFANLPNQVHRKSVKKGFEFTLMVVGDSGLGKSTLINSLFLSDLYPDKKVPDAKGNPVVSEQYGKPGPRNGDDHRLLVSECPFQSNYYFLFIRNSFFRTISCP
ncbi:unnamed protein product, partial [Allacma fusca]